MLYAACSAGALCCTICDISPATQTCPMRPPYRRGFRGGGKICLGTPARMEKPVLDSCGSVAVFDFLWCTTINVQISASAIHFHNM